MLEELEKQIEDATNEGKEYLKEYSNTLVNLLNYKKEQEAFWEKREGEIRQEFVSKLKPIMGHLIESLPDHAKNLVYSQLPEQYK